VDVTTEILIKGGLSLIALAAVVWRHLRPGTLRPEQAGRLLILIAVVAVLAYPNFGGLHGRSGIHHWEQFHYFLGSKYFPELRYDGLYIATIAAERELGFGRPVQSHIRDLRTNEVVPVAGLDEHAREVRGRFSSERWRDFVDDTRYFLTANSYDYIFRIRKDHGYNPTPTWTFTARLFSTFVDAGDDSLALLAWVDPLLLAVMFWMIFRTYGSRIGCLALIVFGLGYPWRFDWVGGAFLRQDWLAAVGAGICLLRRERAGIAGALFAYAVMVRVFPGGFLIGPAVVAARQLSERRPPAWFGRLAVGFAIGVALCVAAGSLTGIGPDAWPQFAHNLEKHHGTWLTNNVGLTNVLLYDRDTMRRVDVRWNLPEPWLLWQSKMNRLQQARRPLLLAAAAALLLITAAAAWRCDRDQAAVLGVVFTFAVALLTCYYWVMLLLIPIGRGRWVPTAGWLAINVGLYGLHLATPAFETIYGLMSWALLAFFLLWIGPDAWRTARQIARPRALDPDHSPRNGSRN
jgi:hypothetical protein